MEFTIEYGKHRFSLSGETEEATFRSIYESRALYSLDVLEELSLISHKDGIVIDIGANIGSSTLYFSKVMNKHVFSFEPHPHIFQFLNNNIRLNNIENLVSSYNIGISRETAWRSLEFDDSDWGKTRVKPLIDSAPASSLEHFVNLDRFPLGENRVSIIHIDVDGHELEIVGGATATIDKYRPTISIRFTDFDSIRGVLEIIRPYNYKCLTICGSRNYYIFVNGERFPLDSELFSSRLKKKMAERMKYLSADGFADFAISAENEVERLRELNASLFTNSYNLGKRISRMELEIAAERRATDYAKTKYAKLRNRAEVLLAGDASDFPTERDLSKQLKQISSEVPRVAVPMVVQKTRFPYFGFRRQDTRRVRIGIATIPSRLESLWVVIESLRNQADEIFISFNGFDQIPENRFGDGIVFELNENIGDFAKFKFLTDEFDGYYITCDDDIEYPPYFVDSILYYLDSCSGPLVAGWHGSVLKDGFSDYYDAKSRRVMTFGSAQHTSQFVHVLGTGCAGFDTKKVRPPYEIFKSPSMADLYLADFARDSRIPMLLVPHDQGEAIDLSHLRKDISSISGNSIRQSGDAFDVRSEVNKFVLSRLPWPLETDRTKGRVLLIGRFDHSRWNKGGIYRSCHLMAKQLETLGYRVTCMDAHSAISSIETISEEGFDIGFVYTGGQSSQDFFSVENIIRLSKNWNFSVLYNLSYDYSNVRNNDIKQLLSIMSEKDGMFVFTEMARSFWAGQTSRRIIVVPKTILPPGSVPPVDLLSDYGDTSGVFMGDLAKYINTDITPDAEIYFKEVASIVGDKNIYFVRQYKVDKLPEYLLRANFIDHASDIFSEIRKCRVYVHCQRYCTFEMLPVEAMFHGIPVLYIDMPQSLNEYIGSAGAKFDSPRELRAKLGSIITRKEIWDQMKRNGVDKAQTLTIERTQSSLEFALLSALAT